MKGCKSRYAAAVSLTVIGAMLTGCGGGGGNVASTPAPPTSTPTPTPTPPVTGANTDLLGPLASETFANDASFGAISVSSNGSATPQGAGALALRIVYDSTTSTYQIANGTQTQNFRASAIDPMQSSDVITTYQVVSGTTTDLLTITNAGTGPGKTRYVGAGFWQHTTQTTGSVNGRVDAFTYGVQTPASAVPRTGAASFDMQLLGVHTAFNTVKAMYGAGRADIDFATGGMYGQLSYDEIDATSGFPSSGGILSMSAVLDAGSSHFAGILGSSSTSLQNGEMHGSFYGPGGEELGATFSINSASDVMAGAIWGARGTYPLNQSVSLTMPENASFFAPLSASIKRNADRSGATTDLPIKALYLSDRGTKHIVYRSPERIQDYITTGTTSYGNLSNSRYLVAGLAWDGRTGFGTADAYVYGRNTDAAVIPRTGSAYYDVSIGGTAIPAGTAMQSFRGTGSLRAIFDTGSLSTIGTYETRGFIGSAADNGTVTGSGNWSGNASLSGSGFDGSIAFNGSLVYSGTLKGSFFGPSLENVGAVAQASSGSGGQLVATLYGTPGTDISGSQAGLTALTEPTTLQAALTAFNNTPDASPSISTSIEDRIEVRYDPTANNYVVRSTLTVGQGQAGPTNATILAADRSVAESNATLDVYHGAGYDARLYRTGSGNPEIALTYTSFAQITQTTTVLGDTVTSTRYVPFGGLTPLFQMPRTGTATYSGVVYGEGKDTQFANSALLSGSSQLTANFATGATSLSMDLVSTDSVSGASRALGSFAYSGAPSCCGPSNRISLVSDHRDGVSGNVIGQFNGPNAAEFGAAFILNIPGNTGNSSDSSAFAGVTVGKRD